MLQAKPAGARWDEAQRRWYAPHPGRGVDGWLPSQSLPVLPTGEDRRFGPGLFADIVTSSCWFSSVRAGLASIFIDMLIDTGVHGDPGHAAGRRGRWQGRRWQSANLTQAVHGVIGLPVCPDVG